MTKEVDLVSYLPPFMADYKEIAVTLEAENPEFVIAWNAAESVLKNEFIESADEYGISRFEKILNILPSKEDTLESRRARVQTRWFYTIPYTLRVFIEKLIVLCGNGNFTIIKNYNEYRLTIITHLELYGQTDELENVIDYMIPANIAVTAENRLDYTLNGNVYSTGGAAFCDIFELSENYKVKWELSSDLSAAILFSGACEVEFTDSYDGIISLENSIGTRTTSSIGEPIELTDTNKDIIAVNNNVYGDPHISYTEII